MKYILIFTLLILFQNCSKPKTVFICGDHICINKNEAQKYFEEKLKDWVLVLISSEPTGAEVRLVDQRLPALGKTPVSLRLPPQRVLNVILTPQRGEVISKEITLKTTPPNQSLNLKIPQKESHQ